MEFPETFAEAVDIGQPFFAKGLNIITFRPPRPSFLFRQFINETGVVAGFGNSPLSREVTDDLVSPFFSTCSKSVFISQQFVSRGTDKGIVKIYLSVFDLKVIAPGNLSLHMLTVKGFFGDRADPGHHENIGDSFFL
ncbi:MAG: hypothetical protein BWY42_00464 [Candidatus Omnitrophica bacterium ADurb.Bin277]|nr:MAG: hypothetical protein BWY42_00464 [Candidatus Omnitrophica bacterium ADurb.Bin277]